MAGLAVMSSKGQIVVPKDLRNEMDLKSGTTFAIFGKEDTLILKKVNIPSAQEAFNKIHEFGVAFAKKKGIKESMVEKRIHAGREIKSA